jgi:hypothetical protein
MRCASRTWRKNTKKRTKRLRKQRRQRTRRLRPFFRIVRGGSVNPLVPEIPIVSKTGDDEGQAMTL